MLAARLATRRAEVDLVAEDGATLVCVEVKTGRIGPRFRPGARLGHGSLRRLEVAAHELARRRGRRRARVDLVEVLLTPGGPTIVHHRGLARPIEHGSGTKARVPGSRRVDLRHPPSPSPRPDDPR